MRRWANRFPGLILAGAALLLFGSRQAAGDVPVVGTCVVTGEESVAPDSLQYAPGASARLTGSGFAPSCSVRVDFDGAEGKSPGKLVNTDPWGGFSITRGLGQALGGYRTDLTGRGGAALSSVLLTVEDSAGPTPSGPVPPSTFSGNFGTADHGAGFTSSLIIPNNGSVGAPAGSTVIVAFSSGPANGGGPVGSCMDTQNNTYSLDVNLPSSSNGRALAICSARVVTALGPADAVTVHFPTNGNGQHGTANVFNGVVSSPLDQTHTASGNSNAPSSGNTATTTQAHELLIGAFAFNGTNFNAFSAGPNFTLTNPSQGAGTNTGLGSEFRVVSSTGQYAADGTLKVATAWLAAIATYKLATPGVVTHFAVSAPSTATGGTPFNFTVTALDGLDNVVTGYTGTVHFTTTDGLPTLPADYHFLAADFGVKTFSATLRTSGDQTITATDTSNNAIAGTSGNINVTVPAIDHFDVTAPANATAGNAFNVTVTARSSGGAQVTNYVGTIHFSSSDGSATVPADYTFLPADLGSKSFSVTLKTAGTQTVSVEDTSNNAIQGTSGDIQVAASTVDHFAVSAPANVTGGDAFSFTVTAIDGFGNTATGYTGTVHFTSTDASPVLPADYSFQAADSGVKTFSATLNTFGSQTITVKDTSNSSIAGTSNMIFVGS